MKKFRTRAIIVCLIICSVFLASCSQSAKRDYVVRENAGAEDGPGNSIKQNPLGEYDADGTGEEKKYDEKIIKNATLDTETKEFEKAVEEIEQYVSSLGGYVEESSITGRNYNGAYNSTRNASYVIRVPAGNFDEFMNKTGKLTNVTSSKTSAVNVSDDYYDIEARLKSLRSERDYIEKLLNETDKTQERISLRSQYTALVYEIESYQTKLNRFNSKIEFSTINLKLIEVVEYTPDTPQSFGKRIKTAFTESWSSFANFCKSFAVGFVYALPTLIILTAIAIPAILISRRLIRKNRKK